MLCMLLSVMMVYKYWDLIMKEDLEFSMGSTVAVWEVKTCFYMWVVQTTQRRRATIMVC